MGLDITGIGSIASLVQDVADKIWPDPAVRDANLLKVQELDNQLEAGQAAINQQEAANNNLFVSGWRPFIGWICGGAFGYHYIMEPFMMFVVSCHRGACTPPAFDMNTLSTVLTGMLGFGALRGFEKMADKGHLPWQQ